MSDPPTFHYDECGAILVNLRDSFQADQQEVLSRMREYGEASDRSLLEMRDVWLSAIGNFSLEPAW